MSTNAKSQVGLYVRLVAKQGKESEVAQFLQGGLAVVQDEPQTLRWFAIRIDPRTFAIFDTFPNEEGRKAHLAGRLAAALMAKAGELLAEPPSIAQVDVLAEK